MNPSVDPVTLDAVALARLRELDPDGRHAVVQRVMTAFETSLSRMVAQLTAELEDGNPGVVSGIAHTLKSSSASVGALALARECHAVEERIRLQTAGDLRADVQCLMAHAQAALAAVGAMLRG